MKAADFLASITPARRKLGLRHFSDEIRLLRAEGCTLKQIVEFLALNGVPVSIAGVSKHLQSTMQFDKVGSSITVDSQTVVPSPAVHFQSALPDKNVRSSVVSTKSDTVESDRATLNLKVKVPISHTLVESLTVPDRQQTIGEHIEGDERRLRCVSEAHITNLLEPRPGVPQEVYLLGDLEHPAIPGLLLTLKQRLSRSLLEIEDERLGKRNETTIEKQFRIMWKTPIKSTPSMTATNFTKMDLSLFPDKKG